MVTNCPLFYSDEDIIELPPLEPEVVKVPPPPPQQRGKQGRQHPAQE